jgi:DNA-binding transcriptional MerR regulator
MSRRSQRRAPASPARERALESARDVSPSHEPHGGAVKMSVLARMSGVPAATIKHYVNEGLLPEPTRTSRNMAYYDVALVPRIQRIKEIQRTRFLPLKVIKEVLDESSLPSADETVTAAIARTMASAAPRERRTRGELVAAGMPEKQLAWLRGAGLVKPLPDADDESYSGDDLELLRVLGASRKAGITPEMLPVTILGEYAQALAALVRIELRLFREGVIPRADGNLGELTEAATLLSEKLVVLLRRKMLLPVLEDLVGSEASTSRAVEAPSGRQVVPKRTPKTRR